MVCWDAIWNVIKCSKWNVTAHVNKHMSMLPPLDRNALDLLMLPFKNNNFAGSAGDSELHGLEVQCIPSAGVHMMSWYPLNMVHPLVSLWTPITVALALIFTSHMLIAQVLLWRTWKWDYSKASLLGFVNRTVAYDIVYIWIYTISHTMVSILSLRTTFCPSCDSKFPVCIASVKLALLQTPKEQMPGLHVIPVKEAVLKFQ